jgi:hypothetical protein
MAVSQIWKRFYQLLVHLHYTVAKANENVVFEEIAFNCLVEQGQFWCGYFPRNH